MTSDYTALGGSLPQDERILESWEVYFTLLGGSPEERLNSPDDYGLVEHFQRLTRDKVDLEPIRNAIRKYKMMEIWGDSLFEQPDEVRRNKARLRALEAKDTFLRLMTSSSNDGSYGYLEWTIKTSLGLRTSKMHTAQAVGGKHWRAWGTTGNSET